MADPRLLVLGNSPLSSWVGERQLYPPPWVKKLFWGRLLRLSCGVPVDVTPLGGRGCHEEEEEEEEA